MVLNADPNQKLCYLWNSTNQEPTIAILKFCNLTIGAKINKSINRTTTAKRTLWVWGTLWREKAPLRQIPASPSCQFLFDLSHRDASHWSPPLLHLWMPHRSSTFRVPKLQSLLHSLELASGVVSEALRWLSGGEDFERLQREEWSDLLPSVTTSMFPYTRNPRH